MLSAKELKNYLVQQIEDSHGKTSYGKIELVNLINAAYTYLLEREVENAK